MSIGVIVDIAFKPGGAAPMIETMKERLPFTRSYDGCEDIHMYVDHDNPNHISRLRYNSMYLPRILERIESTAPEGADLTSWRY